MTEKGNTGLIWEHRLVLWLPRSPLMAAFLIAVCLSVPYLSFQWFFDFPVDRIAFGVGVFITWSMMLFHSSLDQQQKRLEVPLSDRHEMEVRALQMPRDAIRVSRLAGAAGVLALFGMLELILLFEGEDLVTPWIRLNDGSATLAVTLLSGWLAFRTGYVAFAGFWDTPGPQKIRHRSSESREYLRLRPPRATPHTRLFHNSCDRWPLNPA